MPENKSKNTRYNKLLILLLSVVLIAIILLIFLLSRHNKKIIPTSISNKISYVIYWPNSTNTVSNKMSIKYDAQTGVFSFITSISSINVTVTEQATPSEFTDISGYYSTFINHLNNYDTFDSSNGTVYLTEPKNTNGVTAIDNISGTLIFAHAQSSISENNWRIFFNNLKVILN